MIAPNLFALIRYGRRESFGCATPKARFKRRVILVATGLLHVFLLPLFAVLTIVRVLVVGLARTRRHG